MPEVVRCAGAALTVAVLTSALIAGCSAAPQRAAPDEAAVSAEPGERRLIGDWEPPAAFLVGRQELWGAAADSVIGLLTPAPVYVLAPSDGRHESAWVRDFGPIQIERSGRAVWLDLDYDPGRPGNDALPGSLGPAFGVPVERLPLRLDGGGLASDGRGLCAMTESSLQELSPLEAPDVARRLGCLELVVLPPLPGEPTGHIDLMVQFLGPDVVAVATLLGPGISHAERAELDLATRRLATAARAMGRELRVVRIPVVRSEDGRFLSYVNVVALRDHLLVPEFRDVPPGVQRDAHALLHRASDRTVVGIPADEIALGGGGLHCIVLGLHR